MNESSTCDQYCRCEHHKECMTQAPPLAQRLFECSQPLNHRGLSRGWDTAAPATPGVNGQGLELARSGLTGGDKVGVPV